MRDLSCPYLILAGQEFPAKRESADGTLLMQGLARQEGLISLWDLPDVRLNLEQKKLPVAYKYTHEPIHPRNP